jgi:hypothetical protein
VEFFLLFWFVSRVWLQYRTVTAKVMGSIPIRTAMSKRYSESLVQDLNNGLGIDWDKPSTQPWNHGYDSLPRSLTFFIGDAL